MAGRDLGQEAGLVDFDPATLHLVSHSFNPKLSKAYAEGRAGVPATSPHAAGSEGDKAYSAGETNAGDAAWQFETAVG